MLHFLDVTLLIVLQASGTAQTSIVASQIDKAEVTPEQEHRIKWVATALWGGGNDTVRPQPFPQLPMLTRRR